MNADLPPGLYPALEAFRRRFGTRVWTTSPNPLSVWVATLHDTYDRFAFKLEVTGRTEDDALRRLNKLLTEVAALDEGSVVAEYLRWRKIEAGTYESHDGRWRVVNPWRLDTSLRHRWIVQMWDDGFFALDDDYATMREARAAAEYEAAPDNPERKD